MFDLQAESHNNVDILRLTGDVLLADVVEFNRRMEESIAASNVPQAVLDLSQVGRMDNAGLGVLVSISTKLQGRGRRLVLLNPAPHVAQLLKDAEIEGFFPTCESEEELKGYNTPDAAE
ncbi:STAS domain-containing protein [uncultured Desulfovibrio sp.]|uniref:STAS domain-containing protein n=1 Tax=uncultured Desulfovibrio sp. TaxID=167968 RepID=UPI0003AA4706|nr:STAS domain-containing protein [uncultured Desulfovibrio sp.]